MGFDPQHDKFALAGHLFIGEHHLTAHFFCQGLGLGRGVIGYHHLLGIDAFAGRPHQSRSHIACADESYCVLEHLLSSSLSSFCRMALWGT